MSLRRPRTRFINQQGNIDREWIRYIDDLARQSFGVVTLTTDVTGILPPGNGGTGVTTGLNGLVNANISAAAAIAWSKISKTASSLADLAARAAADLTSSEVSYGVVWDGSTGTPTLGDGTLTATYVRIGNRYEVTIKLTIGAGTVIAGTGNWDFSAPVALSTWKPGSVSISDVSAGIGYIGASGMDTTTTFVAQTHGAGLLGEASPIAWAVGDIIAITGIGHV